MARQTQDNRFQKLRLDTTRHSHKAPPSPFASIPHDGGLADSHGDESKSRNGSHSSLVPASELKQIDLDSTEKQELRDSLQDPPEDILTEAIPEYRRRESNDGSYYGSARSRRTTGSSLPGTPCDSERCPSLTPQSYMQKYKINPFTGEPIRRRTRRSDIAPRLQTVPSQDVTPTVDHQANGEGNMASMISDSTASLRENEPATPFSLSGSLLLSPGAAVQSPSVSPRMGGNAWSSERHAE